MYITTPDYIIWFFAVVAAAVYFISRKCRSFIRILISATKCSHSIFACSRFLFCFVHFSSSLLPAFDSLIAITKQIYINSTHSQKLFNIHQDFCIYLYMGTYFFIGQISLQYKSMYEYCMYLIHNVVLMFACEFLMHILWKFR